MVTYSLAVLSYLRNGKLDKHGKAPIYLRITVNGVRAEFSLKRKIESEKWCSVKGRVKGSNPKIRALNHYIDELETKAYDIHSKLVTKKKPFNAELIKNKLLNKEKNHKMLLVIYDEHNDQIEQLLGLD